MFEETRSPISITYKRKVTAGCGQKSDMAAPTDVKDMQRQRESRTAALCRLEKGSSWEKRKRVPPSRRQSPEGTGLGGERMLCAETEV